MTADFTGNSNDAVGRAGGIGDRDASAESGANHQRCQWGGNPRVDANGSVFGQQNGSDRFVTFARGVDQQPFRQPRPWGWAIDHSYRCDRKIKRQKNLEAAIFLSANVSVGSAGYVRWQLIGAQVEVGIIRSIERKSLRLSGNVTT